MDMVFWSRTNVSIIMEILKTDSTMERADNIVTHINFKANICREQELKVYWKLKNSSTMDSSQTIFLKAKEDSTLITEIIMKAASLKVSFKVKVYLVWNKEWYTKVALDKENTTEKENTY